MLANRIQDKRRVDREYVLAVDKLHVEFNFSGEKIAGRIVNLNCFGFLAELFSLQHKNLSADAEVENLNILLNGIAIGSYLEAKIVHASFLDGKCFVGVSFFRKNQEIRLRKYERIKVNPNFRPLVISRHPFKQTAMLNFYVADLSKGGLSLETSKKNRFLLLNAASLDLKIIFPAVGEASFSGVIRAIDDDSQRNVLLISLEIMDRDPDFDEMLVKYLLSFGDFKDKNYVSKIRSTGLKIRSISSHVDFSIASSDDYEEVLMLRREAYSRAGKMSADQPLEAFADIFDVNSNIIIARVREQLVASCRVTYCENETQRFELEESLELPNFIAKTKTLEISRLCITKQFLGTDLSLGIFKQCSALIGKREVNYIITSCTDEMLRRYLAMGFKRYGKPFFLRTMNGIPHYFLILNTAAIFSGKGLKGVQWDYFYRDAVNYLSQFNYLDHNLFERLRIFWKRATCMLTEAFLKWQNPR